MDADSFFAICGYTESFQLLLRQESFEIDMTFKRVKDSNINEVVFAKFMPEQNKGILIYCQYIINILLII